MVSVATVARVREHHVLVLVVADPIVAAACLRQIPLLSAKTALWFQTGLSRPGFLSFHRSRDWIEQFFKRRLPGPRGVAGKGEPLIV